MEGPLWRQPGDPTLYRAMAALFDIGRRTRSTHTPAGVRRFKSIDEMSRQQEAERESRL
jgi:hypothetical protein